MDFPGWYEAALVVFLVAGLRTSVGERLICFEVRHLSRRLREFRRIVSFGLSRRFVPEIGFWQTSFEVANRVGDWS